MSRPVFLSLYCQLGLIIAIVMVGASPVYAQTLPLAGLRLYLPLFGDVRDRGPLVNHGQPEDIRFDTGRGGALFGAAYFNGATSQIRTTNPIALTRDFTIGLWARPIALPIGSQLHALVTLEELDLFISMGFSGDSLGAQLSCRGVRQRPTTVRGQASRLGQWQHLALTRRDSVQRMYLDGQLVDSAKVCTTALEGTTNVWRLGGSPLVRQFGLIGFYTGAASDWVIYNRALTREGIDSLIRHTPISVHQKRGNGQLRISVLNNHTNGWTLVTEEGTGPLEISLHTVHGQSVRLLLPTMGRPVEGRMAIKPAGILPTGVYLLTVRTDQGTAVRRVLWP